jgi:serine/threonine-protein kinase
VRNPSCSYSRAARCALYATLALIVAGCGGGGGGGSGGGSGGSGAGGGGTSGSGGTSTYTIGGSISGLSASGLVLADNGGDSLSVPSAANSFVFSGQLNGGATYDVTVATQPTGEMCTVSGAAGTVSGNVSTVTVSCAAETFTISGTISGLSAAGLALKYYSNGQTLSLAAGATAFAFSQSVPYGTDVSMNVVAQPYWELCTPGSADFSGPLTGNITGDTLSCAVLAAQVTTFAGSTTAGSANGTAAAAQFNGPAGVAFDTAGNLYVADAANNEIRMITPAGVVTTFAGSITPGDSDGTGGAASFHSPEGVAVDSSGNVYVADTDNNEIRKITPTGVVTTFAGSTVAGHADGTGGAASFTLPTGLAIDAAGDLYVADSGNNEIRMITPAGVVSTLAGSTTAGNADGTGSAASFNQPAGVAVDASGNVFVADFGNNEIREVTPSGVVTTVAGSGAQGHADGTGTAASFYSPTGVAVDSSGNIYVADTNNNEIRKITPAGVVLTLAGSPAAGNQDGTGSSSSFKFPFNIALDGSGDLFLADFGNNEIREIKQ